MEKNKTKKYIIRDKQPEDVVFYQKIYDFSLNILNLLDKPFHF